MAELLLREGQGTFQYGNRSPIVPVLRHGERAARISGLLKWLGVRVRLIFYGWAIRRRRHPLKIVIRKGKEPWKVVESTGYNNESHLQALVAEDPTLVPVTDLGASISPFIVAVREVSLRGSGYLDILAFNGAGDMAVMECKLADNPEIRRKVIGQIVEYAAFLNKLDYEALDEIILRRAGQHLYKLMEAKVADPEWDATEFQAAVERNLSDGRFSLIIVVDRMDETLGITLEYLNTCGFRNVSLHALEMSHLSDDEMEF